MWFKIVLSVVAVEGLGTLGVLVMGGQIEGWYSGLNQPPGTPPPWVFGPVWGVLYALMGIAFAIVWHKGGGGRFQRTAMVWFGVQLSLNLAWTPVFFGLHLMLWSLCILVALLLAIGATIYSFKRVSGNAAGMLIPYGIWVSYATYLNAGYWWLNR